MWAHAHRLNVEAIISKRLDAPYRSGRAEDWIKTPCEYRETLVVVGAAFEREELDGLYLARRNAGALAYAGKIRREEKLGFTPEVVTELRARLNQIAVRRQPVATKSPKPGARWVEPVLEARITHRGGLGAVRASRLRHP
jgi:bifunctional non-homologous end joining protein LigD